MCHCYLRGFGFGNELNGRARHLLIWPHGEGVLQQPRRFNLQDFAMYVGDGLPVWSRADPFDRAARLELRFQFRPAKMTRLDSADTNPSQTFSGGAAK